MARELFTSCLITIPTFHKPVQCGIPSYSPYPSAKFMFCKHCVAAPLSRLSIVAFTTTRLPELCTAKPPISTPCLPEMFLTSGDSPTILTSFSPAYRSWYRLRMSRDVMVRLSGMEMVCWSRGSETSWVCRRVTWEPCRTYGNALEPHGNVRDKCNIRA